MPAPLELRRLLIQAYHPERWRTILKEILPSGTIHLWPDPRRIDLPPCEHVDATFDLGSVELRNGSLIERIALVEVHVASQKKLATNRVALRNFVASFLKDAPLVPSSPSSTSRGARTGVSPMPPAARRSIRTHWRSPIPRLRRVDSPSCWAKASRAEQQRDD